MDRVGLKDFSKNCNIALVKFYKISLFIINFILKIINMIIDVNKELILLFIIFLHYQYKINNKQLYLINFKYNVVLVKRNIFLVEKYN